MNWEIEYTDEFEGWWDGLGESAQEAVKANVDLLGEHGPELGFPYSSDIKGSRHGNLRELRVQHRGRPLRVLYAFDPRRCAILLIGGDKTGQNRWYQEFVPLAERLYDEHLETLKREGYDHGEKIH
ncbi:type II toxin-antitoxin system RelE/ParE family toxin [Azotobacter vinelandii]|uniref:type II toxin-antitoxin system RelE/ParE family toxin n=1 Tax=Azotobacter vinelandii TaxID=354 RepID=UPI002665A636|nr:type II toxin-antitoxin system RelE/ParE family toxin [Azotobacter vinelandii]WKN21500.1 type II toxin-antitoxin system RelE/ParE family toxin [Azotobacter vinelandii]